MARGSQSKELITKALLQVFNGAFVDADGKTIRIPTTCEGETIEVKVALTAAKDIVGGDANLVAAATSVQPQNTAMTEAEVAEVRKIIEELHL